MKVKLKREEVVRDGHKWVQNETCSVGRWNLVIEWLEKHLEVAKFLGREKWRLGFGVDEFGD